MAEANAVGRAWVVGSTETPDDLTVVMNLDTVPARARVDLQRVVRDHAGRLRERGPRSTRVRTARKRGVDSFDPTTFTSTFVPNPNLVVGPWIASPEGFDSGDAKVAAMASGEIDVIQDFTVTDEHLLSDDSVTVSRPPSANHRNILVQHPAPRRWAVDSAAREAVAYAVDRQRIDTVYQGEAGTTMSSTSCFHR